MSKKGIDISSWQSGLDLASVKKAGFEFVILRGGFTGYGSGRTKNKDNCFENFYTQAKRNGLGVGVYWYSCADSSAQGKAEAEYLYTNCLKGKQFDYPIYIDVEDNTWQANNKKGVTDAIISFCEYLEAKGYYAGVYASLYWFNSKIDTARLNAYTKWVACWSNTPPKFNFNAFDMWQDSDDGRAGGKRIDTDVSYVDFPAVIKQGGFNDSFMNHNREIEHKKDLRMQKEASMSGINYIKILDKNYTEFDSDYIKSDNNQPE
jgi:GH25 family lysozyme M1 (1,4-beta-N-acetylmuramidase)